MANAFANTCELGKRGDIINSHACRACGRSAVERDNSLSFLSSSFGVGDWS